MPQIPIVVAVTMHAIYKSRLRSSHSDGLDNLVIDAVSTLHWRQATKIAKEKHRHTYNHSARRWLKEDQGPSESALESEEHQDHEGSAVHRLMLKRAIDVANARQLCIGWGFLLIFLVCE